MIKSFGDRETERLFHGEWARRLPSDIQQRTQRRLVQIHTAASLADLAITPSNQLESLRGGLRGFCSIRINRQWRVVFEWTGSDAEKVSIVDYH
ncbi:MAG: plasmid maintenance system killer family protein [Verrucomicrobiaceae bacterium]|nr:plasmid maintenance system killer family protein [Verrucomicrobiaceae bacterium]